MARANRQTIKQRETLKRGRPSKYTPAIGIEICRRLAEGESLRAICELKHMPAESTVRGWVIDGLPGFYAHYARGRELQALRWAEEIVSIADDGRNDYFLKGVDEEGNVIKAGVDHDHIQRSRLRVDTRKWLLSKVLPKVYGDRITTEVTGKDGGPVAIAPLTIDFGALPVEARRAIRTALESAKGK